ncbi:MAG: ATP-binding protein [Xanthobacteraceae bacterium]
MKVATSKTPVPARERIELDDIRVGKDVIEIVTSGMYVSPVTVFREYVQNAADSIDAARSSGVLSPRKHGRVDISFDQNARSVSIHDNGIGIPARDVISTLVAIGASPKRGSNARGFRGVGRLSGLAYCRELQFRTKALGENTITTLSWDCRALRERLADAAFGGDLRRIIADTISVSREKSDEVEQHFFEVQLKDIARLRNDLLLNERMVAHYLSQVAPVPFSPEFSFGTQIEKYLADRAPKHPMELLVAGEQLFRPHRDETIFAATGHKLRIEGIEFVQFPNVDGDVGAAGWIAHHEYVRSILPTLGVRGLRARVGDLQVGDPNLFDEIYKEPRFNGWTIGEIHIYDPRIVPNARRDNFEVNHHHYNLLVQLGPVAAKISHRCRSASVSRNAEQTIIKAIAEVNGRLKQKKSIDRAELSRLKASVLRSKAKAGRVEPTSRAQQLDRSLDQLLKKLARITGKRRSLLVSLEEAETLVAKYVTNRTQAAKLLEVLRRLSS